MRSVTTFQEHHGRYPVPVKTRQDRLQEYESLFGTYAWIPENSKVASQTESEWIFSAAATWCRCNKKWLRWWRRKRLESRHYLIHATSSEITICANQLPPGRLSPPVLIMSLSYCCGALGYFHIIFGTMIFSSLLFIMHIDAILCISRLVVSAAFCRLILIMEFEGMKRTQERKSSDQLFTHEPVFKWGVLHNEPCCTLWCDDLDYALRPKVTGEELDHGPQC